MLPPFIIEQIRQRERRGRERQERSRPRVELPIERIPSHSDDTDPGEDDPERGVIVVDLMG